MAEQTTITFQTGMAPVPKSNLYEDAMSGTAGQTVSRDEFLGQLPVTEWRHPADRHDPSVFTELKGSAMAVLPGAAYTKEVDYGPNAGGSPVEQELMGVVDAGEFLAIVGIGTSPQYGKTFEKAYALVRFDPHGKQSPALVDMIPRISPGEDGVEVGRSVGGLSRSGIPDVSGLMSRRHFSAGIRETKDGPKVVITDMGSSNGTKVHVPNTADFKARQRALQEAWGGSKKWALTYDVAKDLRPSVMREMPTDEESAAQPETIYLHSPNTNTEVNYRASERFPLQSRRSTREMFGLDAATMAVVNLAPTTGAMHAERFSILDRGDIPYGEEYSLFEGGPLLGSHERYVLADKGFMTAANEAQRREDPSYLRRYAEQHGGLRVVNSRQSTHVMAGRANWRYVFGEEAAERVDRNKTVSAGHMGMSFGTGHESEVLIVDGGSTNGTEVIVGPRRSEAIASVMGASAIGGEPTKVYEGRHARQEA